MSAAVVSRFALDPLRVRRAAQSALACVLALILMLEYRLPHGYWALVTIIVLTQPNVGASVGKGLLRLVGTLAGAACGVALLLLVQEPVPFVLLLSTFIVVSAYFGAGRVAPYAFAMFGITIILVSMSGFLDPTVGVSIAVQRSAEVAIGIVVALVVTMLLWPIRATQELPRRLAETLRSCAGLFESVTDAFLSGRPPDASMQRTERALWRSSASHLALLEQAATENRVYQLQREYYLRLILFIERACHVVSAVKATCEEPSATRPQDAFRAELPALIAAIATAFTSMERALREPASYPDPPSAFDAAYGALELRYGELRRTDGFRDYLITDVARFDSILLGLRELAHTLSALGAAVAAHGREAQSAPQAAPVASMAPRHESRWTLSIDGRRLRYGIKAALSVLIALLGWLVLQWPFGASAVLSAFVVTQGSLGSSTRKALLRLAGALIGGFGLAIPSIIFVIPYIDTLFAFSLLVFVVMFLCAYVISGSERISYAGFQAAIAFCLVLVPDAKQDVSMNPAFTRAVAVFLGSLVGVLVVRFVWPVHAARELRKALATALRYCGVTFHALTEFAVDDADTRHAAQQSRAAIQTALERRLELLSEATVEAEDRRLRTGAGARLIEAVEVAAVRLGAVEEALNNRLDQSLRAQIAPQLRQLDHALQDTLGQLADWIELSAESANLQALDAADEALNQRLAGMRAAHSTKPFPPAESVVLLALVERCKEFNQAVRRVADALAPDAGGAAA